MTVPSPGWRRGAKPRFAPTKQIDSLQKKGCLQRKEPLHVETGRGRGARPSRPSAPRYGDALVLGVELYN